MLKEKKESEWIERVCTLSAQLQHEHVSNPR